MKRITRIAALLCAVALLLGGLTACVGAGQTILIIDDNVVTRGMFNFFVTDAITFYSENYAGGEPLDPRAKVSGRTVGDLIVDYACKQLASEYAMLRIGRENGIEMTDEIYSEVRSDLDTFRKEDAASIATYFKTYGMREEDYIEIAALFTLEDRIQEELFGEGGKFYPDDDRVAELRRNFEENMLHVQTVVTKDKDSAGADLIGDAEKIREMMVAGEQELEAIVDSYSITGDADNPNDNYMDLSGDVDPLIAAAVAGLQPGEISEIIHVDENYYIVAVLEKDDAYVDTLAAAEAEAKLDEMLDDAIERLDVQETFAFKNFNIESM